MSNYNQRTRSGIILLVVLTTLTFFSILLAAYLVFSNQARAKSIAIAGRNINRPDANGIINEALMTTLRGTSVLESPFFGEDLLSDFYGRSDATELTTAAPGQSVTAGSSIAKFLVTNTLEEPYDDVLSGRVVTFRTESVAHALVHRSFIVLRSVYDATLTQHAVIIDLGDNTDPTTIPAGVKIWVNGVPGNSPGIGFDGTNVAQTAPAQVLPTGGIASLPAALQPNHLGSGVNKSALLTAGGDFDEPYDAADHNNWFLSHRRHDGSVIPSFHRPAVINYLLNHPSGLSNRDDLAISIARSTFRVLPIHEDHINGAFTKPLNDRFTGGSPNFGLRSPLDLTNDALLDQFLRPLIAGPWDVDNDGDGIADSVWIDLGLPLITSQEGNLLRPMIAMMIEDLSGRLNVNAHGNYGTVEMASGLRDVGANWVGRPANSYVFRGKGAGPADISFPLATAESLSAMYAARYKNSVSNADAAPGLIGEDSLTTITSGRYPGLQNAANFYGGSVDVYGRSGSGITTTGHVAAVNVGSALGDVVATTATVEPTANETLDNPYEFDPSGRLGGDSAFTVNELESLLRLYDFDAGTLPTRLKDLVQDLVAANPAMATVLTTISKSDDRLPMLGAGTRTQPYLALADLVGGGLSEVEIKQMIAPEIRLGRKMDLNRPFGNGVDDPGIRGFDDDTSGTADDASEFNGVIDEPSEVRLESIAFSSADGMTVQTPFDSAAPDYDFDEPGVDARQLFARHLYVLMMTVSQAIDSTFPSFGDTLGTPVPVSDRARYRSRRLAQWAINVADFRDPDSIMSPFEYDEVVSDGWDVDGNLLSDEGVGRGVVWGAESPELLFSESMALHNLNVRDTNLDPSTSKKGMTGSDDEDTDQVRVPQGSLFFEMYCPREIVLAPSTDPATVGIPREIYDVDTSGPNINFAVDLDRTVTTHFDGTSVYGVTSDTAYQTPVWRIAISEPHHAGEAKNPLSPLVNRDTLPDTQSFQPDQPDDLVVTRPVPPADQLLPQRFVFFSNYATAADLTNALAPIPDMTEQARVFFNESVANPQVLPERYFSLTPRISTNLGSQFYNETQNPIAPSDQRFSIETGATNFGLIQYNRAAGQVTPDTSTAILPGAAMVISGFAPTGWVAPVTDRVGLNVSEPLAVDATSYYSIPGFRYTTVVATYPATDAYVQVDATGASAGGNAIDVPEDMRLSGPIQSLTLSAEPMAMDPITGTIQNYRTAYLQRLADPTAGFDPVLNPYMTVDQIAIDLTIFTGEDSADNVSSQGEAPAMVPPQLDVANGSRQRDGTAVDGSGTGVLFSYSTTDPTVAPLAAPTANFFERDLTTTFNYLNAGYGAPQTGADIGRPAIPFAKLDWPNRPFASPLEVMMVPACSPGRLFEEFSVANSGADPIIYPDPTYADSSVENANAFISPYRHLLNFFHSSNVKRTGSPVDRSEFAQALEFLSAKVSYRGESVALLPASLNTADLTDYYSPPFNVIPSRTINGRINLNTLVNFPVFAGLMQGHLLQPEYTNATATTQLGFERFLESRRGYAIPNEDRTGAVQATRTLQTAGAEPINYLPAHLDPRYPTEFAGLFKSGPDSDLAIALENVSAVAGDETNDLRRRSTDAGLLRGFGNLVEQDPDAVPTNPVFPALVRQNGVAPTDDYLNRSRSAPIRYQTLMRMPNLTSDNSQVFAIRMTLGFFEVDASETNSVGAEYRESVGQSQRYKAMFIIDRSIPVGFIPGQDLNARDTVVFERFYQ